MVRVVTSHDAHQATFEIDPASASDYDLKIFKFIALCELELSDKCPRIRVLSVASDLLDLQITWRQEGAHDWPVNALHNISSDVIASGDDQGVVKVYIPSLMKR